MKQYISRIRLLKIGTCKEVMAFSMKNESETYTGALISIDNKLFDLEFDEEKYYTDVRTKEVK